MRNDTLIASSFPVPETVSIYQIYPRNFTREGTLAAAARHLPEIAAMGFSWVYLTPVQPSGSVGRKGSLGSPYAIADYRSLDTSLGMLADFDDFVGSARDAGLRVMLDVVYNHTAPDSVLAKTHPEWFLHDREGRLARKCEDWSDVVDLDFSSSHKLWNELIDTLALWRNRGVDGFRCDVASLVPVDFWLEARKRVDPDREMVWLAESVHPHFLKEMRARGFGGWSEPELHAAFDLTYDYDGWERLEPCWEKGSDCSPYFDYLFAQDTLYPKGARKIRYLENHDQIRAAARFGRGSALKTWTALHMFLPGCTFAYMGQELALCEKPDLFDRDPIDRNSGDPAFREFFIGCFAATQAIKAKAPEFSWKRLANGVYLFLREDARKSVRYGLLANMRANTRENTRTNTHVSAGASARGHSPVGGRDRPAAVTVRLPFAFDGSNLLGTGRIEFGKSGILQPGVLLVELDA
ncbi:MAG: alpha-amylase family glycosyl hydrolase [Rectinemataceae bacterium]